MEGNKESLNHEKSIEDYLFNGYQPNVCESTFDNDQQFAKPIEDEDMFGSLECDKTQKSALTEQSQTLLTKERYKELAKGIIPAKLAADCDDDGMLDLDIKVRGSEPKSKAQLIFDKAASRRVKDKFGLYKGQKLHWNRYQNYLLSNISATKRKQWDSFQHPTDRYDDEEELIEDAEGDPKDDEVNDGDQDELEGQENGENQEDQDDEDGEDDQNDEDDENDQDVVEEQSDSDEDEECENEEMYIDEEETSHEKEDNEVHVYLDQDAIDDHGKEDEEEVQEDRQESEDDSNPKKHQSDLEEDALSESDFDEDSNANWID